MAVAAAAMVITGLTAAAALSDVVSVPQPRPGGAICAPPADAAGWLVVTSWEAAA